MRFCSKFLCAVFLISFIAGTFGQCPPEYIDELLKKNHVVFAANDPKVCHAHSKTNFDNGCGGKLECKNGFYSSTSAGTLKCAQSKWITEPANFACEAGCPYLELDDPQQLGNATIQMESIKPKTTQDKLKYWPAGTAIQTRCKQGYLFDTNEKRQIQVDSHTCIGGGDGWTNEQNKTDVGSRPGLCPKVCQIPKDTTFSVPPKKCDLIEIGTDRYIILGSRFEIQLPNGQKTNQIKCLNLNNTIATPAPDPPEPKIESITIKPQRISVAPIIPDPIPVIPTAPPPSKTNPAPVNPGNQQIIIVPFSIYPHQSNVPVYVVPYQQYPPQTYPVTIVVNPVLPIPQPQTAIQWLPVSPVINPLLPVPIPQTPVISWPPQNVPIQVPPYQPQQNPVVISPNLPQNPQIYWPQQSQIGPIQFPPTSPLVNPFLPSSPPQSPIYIVPQQSGSLQPSPRTPIYNPWQSGQFPSVPQQNIPSGSVNPWLLNPYDPANNRPKQFIPNALFPNQPFNPYNYPPMYPNPSANMFQVPRLGIIIQQLPIPNLPLEIVSAPKGPGIYLPIRGQVTQFPIPSVTNPPSQLEPSVFLPITQPMAFAPGEQYYHAPLVEIKSWEPIPQQFIEAQLSPDGQQVLYLRLPSQSGQNQPSTSQNNPDHQIFTPSDQQTPQQINPSGQSTQSQQVIPGGQSTQIQQNPGGQQSGQSTQSQQAVNPGGQSTQIQQNPQQINPSGQAIQPVQSQTGGQSTQRQRIIPGDQSTQIQQNPGTEQVIPGVQIVQQNPGSQQSGQSFESQHISGVHQQSGQTVQTQQSGYQTIQQSTYQAQRQISTPGQTITYQVHLPITFYGARPVLPLSSAYSQTTTFYQSSTSYMQAYQYQVYYYSPALIYSTVWTQSSCGGQQQIQPLPQPAPQTQVPVTVAPTITETTILTPTESSTTPQILTTTQLPLTTPQILTTTKPPATTPQILTTTQPPTTPPKTTTKALLPCKMPELLDGTERHNLKCNNVQADKALVGPNCSVQVECKNKQLNISNQELHCNPLTGQITDVKTGKTPESLKCVKECKVPKADDGQDLELENKTQLKVTCKQGYFPELEQYQKVGHQLLKCNSDGKWINEQGNVSEPMECSKGCIARPTMPPSGEVDVMVSKRSFNINGKKSDCQKEVRSEKMETVYDGPELAYHCKGDQKPVETHSDSAEKSIPCTNACRALTGHADNTTVKILQKKTQKRVMKFDGQTYVIDGHEYEIKCINKDEFFAPDFKESSFRLKCDGASQHYINQKTNQKMEKIARKCGKPKA